MYDFDNQVVVITGGAGNLGSTIARAFQRRKAHLVLVDRAEDRLQKMFPDLASNPSHFLASGVDLTQPAQVEAMVEQTIARLNTIDVLLNIAGMFRGGTPVTETELSTWQQLMAVNAQSVFIACRAVVPIMIERGSGKIVNIAARPGLKAGAGNAAYAASKSAVLRLTESLSAELKKDGVNVNAVIPGTIDTADNRKMMPKADHKSWVEPEALAEVILFLSSGAARAVHGVALPAYGLS